MHSIIYLWEKNVLLIFFKTQKLKRKLRIFFFVPFAAQTHKLMKSVPEFDGDFFHFTVPCPSRCLSNTAPILTTLWEITAAFILLKLSCIRFLSSLFQGWFHQYVAGQIIVRLLPIICAYTAKSNLFVVMSFVFISCPHLVLRWWWVPVLRSFLCNKIFYKLFQVTVIDRNASLGYLTHSQSQFWHSSWYHSLQKSVMKNLSGDTAVIHSCYVARLSLSSAGEHCHHGF